jgi:hypothetical protein
LPITAFHVSGFRATKYETSTRNTSNQTRQSRRNGCTKQGKHASLHLTITHTHIHDAITTRLFPFLTNSTIHQACFFLPSACSPSIANMTRRLRGRRRHPQEMGPQRRRNTRQPIHPRIPRARFRSLGNRDFGHETTGHGMVRSHEPSDTRTSGQRRASRKGQA